MIRHSSAHKGAYYYDRSELVVEEVKTDVDLSETIAKLMPQEGERIQDQRYWPVWVEGEGRTSVMLWRPGSLGRYADRFMEEFIELWGIEPTADGSIAGWNWITLKGRVADGGGVRSR